MQLDRGSIPSENEDMVEALRRHREILRWETDLLRREITSRDLATMTGKKAYLKRHDADGDGRSISPQLLEQMSLQIKEIKPVSLPYLVDNREEALDLLLHEAHKLAYRIQSLRKEFSATIPLEKLRLFRTIGSIRRRKAKELKGRILFNKSSEDAEISLFKERRIGWESTWGSPVSRCGSFNDTTTLSPMYFTHCAPSVIASYRTDALQIYSFKICDLNDNLKWPLYVYGVVAARDDVDCNRNLLFCRSRANCQVVTEKDPVLHLTGPSRAIVADEPVDFEVELKINCGTDQSQDKALIRLFSTSDTSRGDAAFFFGRSCSANLCLETLHRAVQATILSIRVVGGVPLFEFGGRVACSSSTEESADPTCKQVVLLDSVEKIPEDGLDGYLPLLRNVVSVQLEGGLKVAIQAYGGSSHPSGSGLVYFPAQYCNVNQRTCLVCGSQVEVTVAWSRLVKDKMNILSR
ncbi:hypothetical protein VPH35_041522 [Triticum aestivum]